jgi:acetyl-CoA acetyltransferase
VVANETYSRGLASFLGEELGLPCNFSIARKPGAKTDNNEVRRLIREKPPLVMFGSYNERMYMAEGGSAHPQFEVPYGPLVPSLYALVAQRHMHEYGTTPEQLAEVAVTIRKHASLNPNAHKRELITVDDVLKSRMITSPLHIFDCAIVSDGAAACIVTSADRARDLKARPVHLLGQGYGLRHSHIGDTELTTTGAVDSGRDAFRTAGLTPADVDVAQIYDCFTITVIVELEDLGFCKKGEGGAFVENGRIGLGGALPITTHGGLLSGGHPGLGGGFFHVVEAVRQIRGEAGARQVKDAEVAVWANAVGPFSGAVLMTSS